MFQEVGAAVAAVDLLCRPGVDEQADFETRAGRVVCTQKVGEAVVERADAVVTVDGQRCRIGVGSGDRRACRAVGVTRAVGVGRNHRVEPELWLGWRMQRCCVSRR